MQQSRRLLVLRAVVEDYIRSQEPVGSNAIARKHDLGVSSATVRNDMAALEDEGYLTQPHTSAGRVPTEKGIGISWISWPRWCRFPKRSAVVSGSFCQDRQICRIPCSELPAFLLRLPVRLP